MDANVSGPAAPSRRGFLKSAGASAVLAAMPALARAEPQAAPPNILFILADDLGYADLGCYGRRDFDTPVLDRLATEGLLLTQAYANSAVCSPTRIALITGRYQYRLELGLAEPIRRNEGRGLPAGLPTLPAMLRRDGYATSLVGKWHMGWPPAHGPLQFGYDRFFGVAAGGADYFTHREYLRGGPPPPGLYDGDATVERAGYLTDLLADRAVDELRRLGEAGRSFLLSLHFTAPHWPWEGPGDAARAATLGDLRDEAGGSLETFAEMVRAMDAGIGRVLAELDRQGLARDTIVIFTSDNGGERFSDTWPLRGQKGELLEGGIRVPLLVRWPGRIAPGSRSDQVMASMDWLPTLLAAAGAAPEPAAPPDGENLLDVLTGAAPARLRRLFWRFEEHDQAAVRDGDWKYLRMDGEEHLYDVARDPRERADLATREAALLARLRDDFAAWNATMLAYPEGAPPSPESAGAAPLPQGAKPNEIR